jgi:signal transduction histidine kinase
VGVFALLASALYVTSSPELTLPVAIALTLGFALPLLVRRVWPVPVFAVQLLLAGATGWWAMQVVWSPALVIMLYTVAVLRPRREAIAAAGVLAAGAIASTVHVFGSAWLSAAVALLAVIAATTVFGLYIRTRRVLLDELRDRAARLEVERDQQAALAAAAERTRIAREMHDIVAHHLTVMVTLSDGAAATAAAQPERAAEVMRTVSATGRVALSDTRRLLGVLRDSIHDRAGTRSPLPDLAALDELVERVRAAGLSVRYEVDGAPPAESAGLQLAVYRLIQEALTNTMKHAGPAAGATVRVRFTGTETGVEVVDDGRGSVDRAQADNGRGLIGMRERVEAFGGELRCGPRSPHGWLVAARFPLSTGTDRS